MYKIIFYEDKNGNCKTYDYINELSMRSDKDSRINLSKIIAYFNKLAELGTRIGEPFTKYICDGIWELRPIRNRFFYAYVEDNTFIILHHFIKKSRKTPSKEIKKAKHNLNDYLERSRR